MIKLFGHPMSTCTRKVLFTLHETQTQFEFQLVDFAKGEHKAPAYLARQPFGQLPALEDGGFQLFESRAMCRYIDDKAGNKVAPKDPQQNALMEQWISVEQANFYGAIMTFIYNDVFKRAQKPEDLEKAGAKVDQVAGVIDQHLAKTGKPFLVGDSFTIAEIAYAPYLDYGAITEAKKIFAKHSHFTAWANRIAERPAWQKTLGK